MNSLKKSYFKSRAYSTRLRQSVLTTLYNNPEQLIEREELAVKYREMSSTGARDWKIAAVDLALEKDIIGHFSAQDRAWFRKNLKLTDLQYRFQDYSRDLTKKALASFPPRHVAMQPLPDVAQQLDRSMSYFQTLIDLSPAAQAALQIATRLHEVKRVDFIKEARAKHSHPVIEPEEYRAFYVSSAAEVFPNKSVEELTPCVVVALRDRCKIQPEQARELLEVECEQIYGERKQLDVEEEEEAEEEEEE